MQAQMGRQGWDRKGGRRAGGRVCGEALVAKGCVIQEEQIWELQRIFGRKEELLPQRRIKTQSDANDGGSGR